MIKNKVRVFNNLVGCQQALTVTANRLENRGVVANSEPNTLLMGLQRPLSDVLNDLILTHLSQCISLLPMVLKGYPSGAATVLTHTPKLGSLTGLS